MVEALEIRRRKTDSVLMLLNKNSPSWKRGKLTHLIIKRRWQLARSENNRRLVVKIPKLRITERGECHNS